jgi:hypothetical protein
VPRTFSPLLFPPPIRLSFYFTSTSALTPLYPQYVKQETIEDTPTGRVARATRQISERASTRIGRMAFEIALAAAEVKKQRGGSYGWTVRLMFCSSSLL